MPVFINEVIFRGVAPASGQDQPSSGPPAAGNAPNADSGNGVKHAMREMLQHLERERDRQEDR